MSHVYSRLPQVLILFGSVLLMSLSLLSLRSVAPEAFSVQLMFAFLTLAIAWLISRFDYHLYTFSPWPWYFLTVFLLTLTYIFGENIRGATRWLTLFGFSLQTSELAKPFFILFLATYVVIRYPQQIKSLFGLIVLLSLPLFLVFFQPDFGSAILYGVIIVSGLIAAGINFKHLLILTLSLCLCLPLLFPLLKPYQLSRLNTFFNQDHDPQGAGYNAHQSLIAAGSGQLFGRGLGQGTQSHLRFLPERHTDFVFASTVEELGFVGGSLILLGYLSLALGLLSASRRAVSEVGSIICLISLALIFMQAFINLGMNMGILPVTGVTLPLVSSGGSSMLSLGILLGLCLSIAARPQISRQILQIR